MLSLHTVKLSALPPPSRRSACLVRSGSAQQNLGGSAPVCQAIFGSGQDIHIDRGQVVEEIHSQEQGVSTASRRAMVGGAWVAATACWLANCESAEANTSSRKKKDKKKASAAGGTGPSLTKNSEKVSEKNEREADFQERIAKIKAGGTPSF